MPDNTSQSGTATIAADDVATLNGAASAGVLVQRVKVGYGDDNTARDVSEALPLPVREVSATPTLTTVAASTASVTLIAANANRRGLILHSTTGSAVCYVRLGAAVASTAAGGHTLDMAPGAYYEVPFGYTGEVRAIWASATGALNVTEMSSPRRRLTSRRTR
jgi:hypothetical protein